MTFEDFVESVVAGWVPIAWHPVMHALGGAWHRLAVKLVPFLVLVLARLRR